MGKRTKPNYRGRYWLINMLKFYSMRILTPRFRDENLWIFGCWMGEKYDDNSRSLFEHINKNHNDVRAVWLTMNPVIVKEVRDKGYEVYMAESEIGKKLQKKAGVVFYTNGMDDFGFHPVFYGALICAMWHGLGIKHHYFAGMTDRNLAYYKNRIQMKIFSWVYRDITVTASETSSEFFRDSFCISNKSMALTGFPRNDVFRQRLEKSEIMGDIRYAHAKIILYMPTYRNYEDNTIKEMIYGLSDDTQFTDMLEKENVYVVVKKHHLTEIDIGNLNRRIVILDNKKVSSAQELISVADILITDYSSCIFDFSILERPSVLYVPDFELYVNKVGILDRWRTMYMECGVNSLQDLCKILSEAIQGHCYIAEKTTSYVKEEYTDVSIRGDCYSENVYRYVRKYQKRRHKAN